MVGTIQRVPGPTFHVHRTFDLAERVAALEAQLSRQSDEIQALDFSVEMLTAVINVQLDGCSPEQARREILPSRHMRRRRAPARTPEVPLGCSFIAGLWRHVCGTDALSAKEPSLAAALQSSLIFRRLLLGSSACATILLLQNGAADCDSDGGRRAMTGIRWAAAADNQL